ncbi:MAG: helix-turn-helix domain containing protein [Ancalomicrobiaceae bacterium]|nr:helix-turn-helix domain containing protein [Ancalomicrobiaceae bacterium]
MSHQMVPRPDFTRRLTQAFLDHGYDQLNMAGLAKAVDITRRTLYNYFSNKEEAFRFLIEQANITAIKRGIDAGREKLAEGGSAIDVITTIINIRYGENRRLLMASPHATEINDQAFRRCRDLMVGAAITFQAQLADIVVELQQAGRLTLKPDVTPAELAQVVADGARGTNQSLPPVAGDDLEERYRKMVAVLLYGSANA